MNTISRTLDAHGHLLVTRSAEELASCGAVVALTLSLDEAARALERRDPLVAWGVGCYPRLPGLGVAQRSGACRTIRP